MKTAKFFAILASIMVMVSLSAPAFADGQPASTGQSNGKPCPGVSDQKDGKNGGPNTNGSAGQPASQSSGGQK